MIFKNLRDTKAIKLKVVEVNFKLCDLLFI